MNASSSSTPATVPTAQPEAAPANANACPRCDKPLIDPDGLGWCRACGYCRSLEEERAKQPLDAPAPAPGKSSPFGIVEFGRLLVHLPSWLWVLLGGFGLVVLMSLPAMLTLPEGMLSRCLWSTVQIIVGVLMILAAQFWALMELADSDDRLGAKDGIISGRLWVLTLARLPETRKQVWLAAWGLAAILAALFLIGGLSHWFTYLPGR